MVYQLQLEVVGGLVLMDLEQLYLHNFVRNLAEFDTELHELVEQYRVFQNDSQDNLKKKLLLN